MSLSQKIGAALDERIQEGGGRGELAVDEGGARLSLELEVASAVGVTCDSLTYQADASRGAWSVERLRGWGDELARRLTYLMEPLQILEVDLAAQDLLIRSETPSQREGKRTYYEIRLGNGGLLRMTRRSFDEATRRLSRVPCQFTRETLERLADDLGGCIPAA